ncbi:MAG: cytochrome c oxidase accessory protein CcoG [Bacteroidetes bacterium]|nr:cytochrome c oxidase accessory protein CcoG [Bacteroidota bacterium]
MDESFRDSIGTLDEKGKRKWVFAKKTKGRFTTLRTLVSIVLLGFLFAAPLVRINGNPLLLFNILERKFYILGQPFWPQDFYLVVLGFIASLAALALFTVAFGRIFCGWICPQTIFMEMVFRRIEYWIEGDAPAQKRLSAQSWNLEKTWKRSLKHLVFWGISFLIGNTFLAYIIGSEQLFEIITSSPADHIEGFIGMVVFTTAFYLVFSQFREQVCIVACPYGRLQGVLLDNNSVVVAYDYSRGEPRGKFRKGEERTLGDCINCYQCVQVCPTGIDIRNGTQLECVNCTACIDACDDIMTRIGKPRGLIRYASQNEIALKQPFRFSGRMKGYAVVVALLLGLILTLLFTRKDVETTVLRMPGSTYQELKDGSYANIYKYQLINKTNRDMAIELHLLEPTGGKAEVTRADKHLVVPRGAMLAGQLVVTLPYDRIKGLKTEVTIGVYVNGALADQQTVNFLGPIK